MKRFAEDMTIHGVPRVFKDKNLAIKLFWLILVFGSSSYFTYQVIEVSKSFLNYSVVTKFEKKTEKPMQFPTITFCPRQNNSKTFRRANMWNDTKWNDIIKQEDKGASIFLSYSLGTQNYKYPVHFKYILLPYMGLCYSFNVNGSLYQNRAGSLYGLNIELFIMPSNTTSYQGVLVMVHHIDEFPFPLLDRIFLPPGFWSNILLRKTTVIRKDSPYKSNCTHGWNKPRIFPGYYTVPNCEMSCTESEAMKRCGLTLTPVTATYLPYETRSKLLKRANSSLVEKCFNDPKIIKLLFNKDCKCQIPCHEIRYHKTLSFLKWPNDHLLPEYKRKISGINKSTNISANFLRSSLFAVSVYFDEMAAEIITEVPEWTATKFISDIGGQMGVWLGASVFSVIELLFLIGYTPFMFRSKKKYATDDKV